MIAEDLRDQEGSYRGPRRIGLDNLQSYRRQTRRAQWHHLRHQQYVIARNHYQKLDRQLRRKRKV